MEKKKSSNATNYTDFAEIDEDKKDQIRKYFPAYFSEDEKDMEEEVKFFSNSGSNQLSMNTVFMNFQI